MAMPDPQGQSLIRAHSHHQGSRNHTLGLRPLDLDDLVDELESVALDAVHPKSHFPISSPRAWDGLGRGIPERNPVSASVTFHTSVLLDWSFPLLDSERPPTRLPYA